jgi:uncharacterized protein with ATP-grasp and redox domains
MAKRVRTDGHLRREEYDFMEQQAERASNDPRAFDPNAKAGTFAKADSEQIKKRRIVKINRRRPTATTTTTEVLQSQGTMPSVTSSTNPFVDVSMKPTVSLSSSSTNTTTNPNPFSTFSMIPTSVSSVNNDNTSSSSSSSSSSSTTSTTKTNPFSTFSMVPTSVSSVNKDNSSASSSFATTTTNTNPFSTFSMVPTSVSSINNDTTVNVNSFAAGISNTAKTTTPPTITLRNEVHPFVLDTFQKRIPAIIANVSKSLSTSDTPFVAWNDFRETMLKSISTEIPLTALVHRPANKAWNNHLQPFIKSGKTMKDIDTFFLENLVYRYLLDLCGYWDNKEDPFRYQKQEALFQALTLNGTFMSVATLRDAFYAAQEGPPKLIYPFFRSILLLDLWGNRADLSLSGGKAVEASNSNSTNTLLLGDDVEKIWNSSVFQSGNAKGLSISIVLDNCGLELCTDLVLSEMLLDTGVAKSITLYAKNHPIFVSDALPTDVHHHIQQLSQWVGTNKAIDLAKFIESKQLVVKKHPFFNSGYPCKDMFKVSPDLYENFGTQDLVIFKGDANYRRLLGEQKWKETEPFENVVSYLPSPTLAIRTLKYPLSCGASSNNSIEKAKQMFGNNEWNCVGNCGVIHFSSNRSK